MENLQQQGKRERENKEKHTQTNNTLYDAAVTNKIATKIKWQCANQQKQMDKWNKNKNKYKSLKG